MSPLDLYELTVQSPRTVVATLLAIHGHRPSVLREDFCGTGAISRRWVGEGLRRGEAVRAVGVDLDPAVLDHARAAAEREGLAERAEFVRADAVECEVRTTDDADVIYVGNFSIGEIRTEAALAGYLGRCRRRLMMGNHGFGGGVMVLDLYGGPGAFEPLEIRREHRTRGREVVEYVWRHDAGDPHRREVENSISFRVVDAGGPVADWPRAFVYRWRLWTIEEMRGALLGAGFEDVRLYAHEPVPPGHPPRELREADLPTDWIVYLAARAPAGI